MQSPPPETLTPTTTRAASTAAAPTPQSGPASPTLPAATSTAIPPSPTPVSRTTYSTDGRNAFPVAGDIALMTWSHFHWDGSNAVDIEAARHLASDSPEFKAFTLLPAVAVVSGTIAIADNHYGGLALNLYGTDGDTYYYGHLSEQWVTDGQAVRAGEWLGLIGNTGYNTQYIEPHLHFSISTQGADNWRWEPDVNAAERFLTWFNLPWQDLNIPEYPLDQVAGWPLRVPANITRGFDEPQAVNPDQGSIDIAPSVDSAEPVPVYATLGGEVNVNRATVMGLRTQITNRPSRTTVVFSFLLETTVADCDVVQRGDVIGTIDPRGILNYMLFVKDIPTDPMPTLGDPPQQ